MSYNLTSHDTNLRAQVRDMDRRLTDAVLAANAYRKAMERALYSSSWSETREILRSTLGK